MASTLSDLFKKNSNLFGGSEQNYGIKRYSLPNNAGDYSATGGITQPAIVPAGPLPGLGQTPIYPTLDGKAPKKIFTGGGTGSGAGTGAGTPPPPPPVVTPTPETLDYSKYGQYINPQTKKLYTPEEYDQFMMTTAQGGSVPNYAMNSAFNQNQSAAQMQGVATGLNNQRNDIVSGEADPYGVASKSGMNYTPEQLRAIQKAYAGIYDPALQDVFTKLEIKQKKDAQEETLAQQAASDERDNKYKLEQMAQQHKYDMAEKSAPTYSDIHTAATNAEAGYVEGANPIVDGWVQRLNQTGQDINAAIPGVKNQGLRDAVMMGLNASKSKSAKMAGTLDDINTISTMLMNPKLENISGPTDQFMGGLFGEAKTAKTQYNQIVGALQLAKAGQIKGQGQISDYERKVLKEASAAIDRGMNDEEFRKALVKLRGVLQTSSGLEAKVKITDPSTGESDNQSLNTAEINKFIEDGAIITYLE